jgi:hypothetical protein
MSETEFDAVYGLLSLSANNLQQRTEPEEFNLMPNIRIQIRYIIKDFVRGCLCFRQNGDENVYDSIALSIDEALYYNANGDFMVYADPKTMKRRIFELISHIISTMYFHN